MKNKNAPMHSTVATHLHNICYVAGRSGGHMLPALTLARQHKDQYPHAQVLFIATTASLDTKILSHATVIDTSLHLSLGNVPASWLRRAFYLVQMMRAFVVSLYALKKHKITKVISTGGYVSIPVCFAAYCLRIPIHLYELNVKPGKATQLLAKLAHTIYTCFKTALPYFPNKAVHAAYPLRYTQASAHQERVSHKKTLLILGGSQGSAFLNESIAAWLESVQPQWRKLHSIHQTGAPDHAAWQTWYADRAITADVFDFRNDIADVYTQADLVICRAGAGTLFELAFFNKRCIVIPLVTAQTAHQVDNALYMAAEYPHLFTLVHQADIEKDFQVFAQVVASELKRSTIC